MLTSALQHRHSDQHSTPGTQPRFYMLSTTINQTRLILTQGDISTQKVDAIVNAANSTLLGGGGVDGAIHRAGGPLLLADCKQLRATKYPDGLPTGEAVSTTAGRLDARRVVHTVGPIWRGGSQNEAQLLAAAYRNSLRVVAEEGLHTVAFPSLSTGAYGYPKREAARIAVAAVADFLRSETTLHEVRFVLFSEEDLKVFSDALNEVCQRRE